MRSYDVVMIVPLAEEFDHIKRVFDVNRSFVRNRITFYELSVSDADLARPDLDIVAVVLSQMGNANAAQKTERVLSMIDPPGPQLVSLVGIAGRLDDDLGLSDVVVGTEVTNYEVRSKLAEDTSTHHEKGDTRQSDTESAEDNEENEIGTESEQETESGLSLVNWKPGGRTYSVASEVFESVSRFRNEEDHYETWRAKTEQQIVSWVRSEVDEDILPPSLGSPDSDDDSRDQLTDDQFDTPLQAANDPLASGSFVITSKEFTEKLAKQNRNFAAVEMEAAGVLMAVQRTTGVNAIVIRGISDLADDGKGNLDNMGSDGGLWRRCAAYAAANYLAHFLAAGSLSEAASPVDRPALHQNQTVITDSAASASANVTELSASDFETETTGPAHSFLRRYVKSSGPTIKSDLEQDGISLNAEFSMKVPERMQLSRISLTPEFRPDIQDVYQEVLINGVERKLRTGTQEYLDRPVEFGSDDPVRIEITSHSTLRSPSDCSIESADSVSIEVACEFESPSSEDSLQYVLNGYISRSQGVNWIESQIN